MSRRDQTFFLIDTQDDYHLLPANTNDLGHRTNTTLRELTGYDHTLNITVFQETNIDSHLVNRVHLNHDGFVWVGILLFVITLRDMVVRHGGGGQ